MRYRRTEDKDRGHNKDKGHSKVSTLKNCGYGPKHRDKIGNRGDRERDRKIERREERMGSMSELYHIVPSS